MIDLQLKLAIAAALAWLVTRRVTPANAARAHRVWLVVVLSPALWLAGEWCFAPVAYVGFREGVVPSAVAAPSPGVQQTIVAVYLCVTWLLLVRVAVGVLSVRRLLRGARELAAADRSALPLDWPSEIRETRLDVPVTAGFLKPVILLPSNWRRLSPPALEAILRHEAAHVRRGDCAVALTCAVIEAVVWFNPFVWLASRQVRWFAEMACDAEASAAMHAEVYASELLTLAEGWRRARRPLHAITAGAETDVGRRISLLLDDLERGWRRRLVLPVAAAVLVCAIPLAGTVRVGRVVRADSGAAAGAFDALHRADHQLRHTH